MPVSVALSEVRQLREHLRCVQQENANLEKLLVDSWVFEPAASLPHRTVCEPASTWPPPLPLLLPPSLLPPEPVVRCRSGRCGRTQLPTRTRGRRCRGTASRSGWPSSDGRPSWAAKVRLPLSHTRSRSPHRLVESAEGAESIVA